MCNDHDRPVQTKNDDYGLQARGLKRKNKEHYFEKSTFIKEESPKFKTIFET